MTLKEILKVRGMSQSDLVREMGVSSSAVSYWCNGPYHPNTQMIEKLAAILNVPITSLTFEQNPETKNKINAHRRKYYVRNKDKRNACDRKYRAKNKDKIKAYHREYRAKNKDKRNIRVQECRAKLTAEVMGAYGGKCGNPSCSESRLAYLQIHHIGGGGNNHRKEIGRGGLYRFLKKAGFPKDRFMALCVKCHRDVHRNLLTIGGENEEERKDKAEEGIKQDAKGKNEGLLC